MSWRGPCALPSLALLATLSCTPGVREAEPPSGSKQEEVPKASVSLRGLFTFGHEVRAFRPCGGERELWVIPTPDLLAAYGELGLEPYSPVVVELEGEEGPPPETGFGADYHGQLEVFAFRDLGPVTEGHDCPRGGAGTRDP